MASPSVNFSRPRSPHSQTTKKTILSPVLEQPSPTLSNSTRFSTISADCDWETLQNTELNAYRGPPLPTPPPSYPPPSPITRKGSHGGGSRRSNADGGGGGGLSPWPTIRRDSANGSVAPASATSPRPSTSSSTSSSTTTKPIMVSRGTSPCTSPPTTPTSPRRPSIGPRTSSISSASTPRPASIARNNSHPPISLRPTASPRNNSTSTTSSSSSGNKPPTTLQPKSILKVTSVDQYTTHADGTVTRTTSLSPHLTSKPHRTASQRTASSTNSSSSSSAGRGSGASGGEGFVASEYDTSELSEKEVRKLEKKGVNPALYLEMKALRKGRGVVGGLTGNSYVS